MQWLWHLHTPCLIPDVTFFLDVPVQICLDRIASSRTFHFEIYEKKDTLNLVRENYFDAIDEMREKNQKIQIADGKENIAEVAKDIHERMKLMFFESKSLSFSEQKELIKKWPDLLDILNQSERELGLSLLTITRISGGYQLTLAGKEGIYHLQTRISRSGTMIIRNTIRLDNTEERLRKICSQEILPYNQPKLPGV
jgi:hypothetical protein